MVVSPREIMSRNPLTHVSYSCGSCGYPLNLTPSSRITSGIGSKYRKLIKKGSIAFLPVDLSRFTQVDEVSCFPVGFWTRGCIKTRLLCCKCGTHIEFGHGDSISLCGFDYPDEPTSSFNKFTLKIQALQPSEDY